jgi:predicted transcriptional regulator YdeE
MDINDKTSAVSYNSLKEIQLQKKLLLRDIHSDNKQISTLWERLFKKNTNQKQTIPTKRINILMSAGTSVLDGLILGWKLYRKFRKK